MVKYNNELSKPVFQEFFTRLRIQIKPSALNTQTQNKGVERLGGVIKDKIRLMRVGTKLLALLWPEISRAIVYLYNKTPRFDYNWKTPYDRFHTFMAHRDSVILDDRKPN